MSGRRVLASVESEVKTLRIDVGRVLAMAYDHQRRQRTQLPMTKHGASGKVYHAPVATSLIRYYPSIIGMMIVYQTRHGGGHNIPNGSQDEGEDTSKQSTFCFLPSAFWRILGARVIEFSIDVHANFDRFSFDIRQPYRVLDDEHIMVVLGLKKMITDPETFAELDIHLLQRSLEDGKISPNDSCYTAWSDGWQSEEMSVLEVSFGTLKYQYVLNSICRP